MGVQEPHPVGMLPPTDKAILVYTDGGCDLASPGSPGAWAFVYTLPGETILQAKVSCGNMMSTTNNRMELMAVIKALETVEIGPRVVVVSDSQYVINGCTVWCRNWIKNGWKTAEGNPVKNRDLWETLHMLVSLHNVRFDWVKGHTGNPMNQACDNACTKMIAQAKTALEHGFDVEVDLEAA